MNRQSSYTEEEILAFEEEIKIKNLPKSRYWTTIDGIKIPHHRIKDNHLKNILKHLEVRIKNSPTELLKDINNKCYERLEKELKKRLIKTPAGKILYGR